MISEKAKLHYPIILALSSFYVVTALCLMLSLNINHGHLVYALDDPYIHMAIAKNFAQHGVWGISKCEFSASNSSLLWPLLLSLIYFLFGVGEWAPFVLNIVFATAVCFLSYLVFRKYKIQNYVILGGLTAIVFFTSLFPLIFSGMEHTLHLFITIAFIYYAAGILSSERSNRRNYTLLLILSLLLTMIRYEGIFLIFIVTCLFIAKRNFFRAFCLATSGLLPIFVYGLFSVTHGWYFLPNSVLLKGNIPAFSSLYDIILFFFVPLNNFSITPHVSVLVITALLAYIVRANHQKEFWEDKQLMIVLFVMMTFLHMQFAQTGWFYRYEAYLIGSGIFILTILLGEYLSGRDKTKKWYCPASVCTAWVLLFCLLTMPLMHRGIEATAKIPVAMHNIYEQQYQMGLFIKRFYQGKVIILNDIGAVNYLADINTMDLCGLASMETARLKAQKIFTTENIENMIKKHRVGVAIVYDSWFTEQNKMLANWVKAGQWEIPINVVCGSKTVSFYAVNPLEKNNLIKNLRFFSNCLPEDVIQSGAYTRKE